MDASGGAPPRRSLKSLWNGIPATSRGIALMVASTIGFSLMHASVRYVSSELHPLQIVFFRNFFGAIFFLPLIAQSGLTFLRTARLPMHLLRAALNVVAMSFFFMALALAPLAQVNALGFTAPLFTAVLTVFLLGERFRARRWTAIVLGFCGALIIIRPGVVPIDTGSLYTLASAFIWALTMIVIRSLGRTESSMTTTGYVIIFLSIFSLGPAIYVWQTPQAITWAILVLIALTGTAAQTALAEALKIAETTAILPFDFLKIVWASALGFLLFAEVPTLYVFAGAAIIFSSGLYVAWRERQVSQKTTARPATLGSPSPD